MTKKINLINCKEKVLVDDKYYKNLKQFKWAKSPDGYARATINGVRYFMHRYLLRNKFTKNRNITDHINNNPLDNRMINLRICDQRQNVANKKKKKGLYASKYKGVTFDKCEKRIKRWRASCEYDGKTRYAGRYLTEIEAARAYNRKAKELWGKYANLNKIK